MTRMTSQRMCSPAAMSCTMCMITKGTGAPPSGHGGPALTVMGGEGGRRRGGERRDSPSGTMFYYEIQ